MMTREELEHVIDVLWSEMPVEQVRLLRREQPDVVALCQEVHERIYHSPRGELT